MTGYVSRCGLVGPLEVWYHDAPHSFSARQITYWHRTARFWVVGRVGSRLDVVNAIVLDEFVNVETNRTGPQRVRTSSAVIVAWLAHPTLPHVRAY